ncbi:phosphatidylinositol-specific phospholipase C domain-containing protein [Sphingomonas sp. AOB5]|uniref:phosphatidylinositol-specific phospholipase C domain-containing protein n=1 Tax=Sphingomonas sp. AOB5 TaxID=3034017 RepID=UPI0023F65909|nr:phosphatidylinositol-specific phospholipase C domain-containing protein [Sphingomonas sp. AOB5]MDF7774717.1 phosphatidylinositol-specific phospholipase C domain-containing protein [Sphingomonas sp. AOB5]
MVDRKNWMSAIPDTQSVGRIALPGTHDAATHTAWASNWNYAALGWGIARVRLYKKFVQCQAIDVAAQLDHGVRFLDLRVKHENGELPLYHGSAYLDWKLPEALDMVEKFLKANPTETVLVSIKDEDGGDRSGTSDAIKKLLEARAKASPKTPAPYTKSIVPVLKDVRGKWVLINRTYETKGFGIFANLKDNAVYNEEQVQGDGTKVRFAIQDVYAPLTIEGNWAGKAWDVFTNVFKSSLSRKIEAIRKGYAETATDQDDLRIAFISANDWPSRTPGEFADDLNPQVRKFLREWAGGKPWITVLDYAGHFGKDSEDPVAAIIASNSFVDASGTKHRDSLGTEEELKPGERLVSQNNAFEAVMQKDGNFVVYRDVDRCPMASTSTHGEASTRAVLQYDGNFVIYAGTKPLSHTDTANNRAKRLTLQGDGNLVLYDGAGKAVWSILSNSFVRR